MRYDIDAQGNASNAKVFFDMSETPGEDAIDGFKFDQNGNLYICGPGGIHMFASDGKHLGSIATGVPTGNLAWSEGGSSLFITSNTNVYCLKLTTRGASFSLEIESIRPPRPFRWERAMVRAGRFNSTNS